MLLKMIKEQSSQTFSTTLSHWLHRIQANMVLICVGPNRLRSFLEKNKQIINNVNL